MFPEILKQIFEHVLNSSIIVASILSYVGLRITSFGFGYVCPRHETGLLTGLEDTFEKDLSSGSCRGQMGLMVYTFLFFYD